MSNRKLQGEIDRCLKKVSEGIEEFEQLYDKIYQTTNQSQKDKIEAELKKEIKKLQRLRDQIKVWLSSNEIKDKKQLLDTRKLIETQMEKFKACEREMKTKQYSKEGLQAKEKLDPSEIAKQDASNWISTTVDKLTTQVDAFEAESELLLASKSKRGAKVDNKRIAEIEKHLERHRFHMTQLETVLRLMENDALTVEDVDSIKDSLEYYVESHQEPDFEEDLEMYSHLNLEEDEVVGYLDDHTASQELDSDVEESALSVSAGSGGSKKTRQLDASENQPTNNASPMKGKSSTSSTASSATAPSSVKTASANVSTKAAKTPTLPTISGPATKTSTAAAPAVKLPAPPVQKYAAAASSGLAKESVPPVKVQPESKEKTETPVFSFSSIVQQSSKSTGNASPLIPLPTLPATPNTPLQNLPTSTETTTQPTAVVPISAPEMQQGRKSGKAGTSFPAYFADLISSFESSRKKTYGRGDEVLRNQHLLAILDSSFQQCPDIVDSERPLPYTPLKPATNIPACYPKIPMLTLASPSIFDRFDIDTLFFIFYYQQGTRQQYLAARELKRQSWRFHKKYLTWFQRHEEPKSITDEYEQGTYIYFDYEGAWCQRKKTEFTFEYGFLEDSE